MANPIWATQKRSFASDVSGLGEQSYAILEKSWNGEEFQGLELPLNTLTSELNTLTSNHKAYPILHYFYSPRAKHAPAVSVVVLDELLANSDDVRAAAVAGAEGRTDARLAAGHRQQRRHASLRDDRVEGALQGGGARLHPG